MQNLMIEQIGPQGPLKTWRIRPSQGRVSFGQSKHADLRTSESGLRGMQGAFEYRQGHWYYLNLDVKTQETSGMVEICINETTEICIGTTNLKVTPLSERVPLFSNFEKSEINQSSPDKKSFHLMTVTQGSLLLETKLIPVGKVFVPKNGPGSSVAQRLVYLSSVENLQKVSSDQLIDEGGKKTLMATLAGACLLALFFLVSPSSKNAGEAAVASAPPPEYREIKLQTPKRKHQSLPVQAQKAPTQAQPQASNAAIPPSPQTGGGASSALKALGKSRLSQLIGKISASSAKSQNVVITNGIAAGSAPSGRALASVGAVTDSGHDWSGDGKGKNIRIGTAGHAGTGTTNGVGQISAGKTGNGGVGLLEEDGEVVGGLDREVIAAYIRSQLGQILYCYERQLSAQPDLFGKVAVKFTISGSGMVETQRIGETTLKSSMVEGCILQRVAKWKFPTPQGGTKVVVTYPFLFKSTN